MLTITAPAKINLTLEILRKRPDGFHEIRSVFQAIDLADRLTFEAGEDVVFKCNMPGWSAGQSLVTKAAEALREISGFKKGAVITIEKKIPMMSGLGGDSSDAAAVLKGLNELWDLKLPPEKLAEIGVKLGSDIAFFLNGKTALAVGRGEKITSLPSLPTVYAVLVLPNVPVELGKTGRMYSSLKPSHFTDGSHTRNLVEALEQGKPFRPAMLYNAFENVAFEDFTIRQLYVEPVKRAGALHVHLAGSGPMLFTIFSEKTRAEELYKKCQSQGMQTYLAATL